MFVNKVSTKLSISKILLCDKSNFVNIVFVFKLSAKISISFKLVLLIFKFVRVVLEDNKLYNNIFTLSTIKMYYL